MHQVEGALLLGVGDPHDLVQFGAAVLFLERAEQAAALDAGELLVVAGEDQLGAGRAGVARDRSQMLGRQHPGFIDDQHRARGPIWRRRSRGASARRRSSSPRETRRGCMSCTTALVQAMPMTR